MTNAVVCLEPWDMVCLDLPCFSLPRLGRRSIHLIDYVIRTGRVMKKTMAHRRSLQFNVDSNHRGRGELKSFAFPKLCLLMILAYE